MGQGQFDIALQHLRDCARKGDWLMLKNLHLVWSWLPVLEKEINSLRPNDSFRLWLTSEAHPKFSSVLLQSSLKVRLRLNEIDNSQMNIWLRLSSMFVIASARTFVHAQFLIFNILIYAFYLYFTAHPSIHPSLYPSIYLYLSISDCLFLIFTCSTDHVGSTARH